MENQEFKRGNGRILAGLFLLGIGAVLFIKQFGFPMPYWLFQWPMILIIIGIFTGIRHNFRGPGWLILIIIGSVFMVDMISPDFSIRRFTTPLIVVGIGLVMILRPKRGRFRNYYDPSGYWKNNQDPKIDPQEPQQETFKETYTSKEDYIDSVSVFGNVRKVVVSKDFKGGDMLSLLGGSEIDLSQADITGRVVMDVTVILGGTKLILPSHWDVKSEMVAFFGGIEDKRQLAQATSNPEKILVLKGTSIFGGIEIRNY